MKRSISAICLLPALLPLILATGCVKSRTVSQDGRVVSQGPVLVSPVRGTLRSHTDRQ